MDVVLNETSLHDDFVTSNETFIYDFHELILRLSKEHVLTNLLIESSFWTKKHSFFTSVINKLPRNEDKRVFLTLWQKCACPFERNANCSANIIVDSKTYLSEGACKAVNLKHNAMLNFTTHDFWKANFCTIDYCFVDGEDLKNLPKKVFQLSTKQSVCQFFEKHKNIKYDMISSGQDLLEQWSNLFPNLIKCGVVDENLRTDPEKFHIDRIIEQLDILQTFFQNRKVNRSCSVELNNMGVDVSDESGATKDNSICENERTFSLPNGEKAVFWLHMKFEGKFTTRLHFLPKPGDLNHCYVGYISRHLDTSKDIR